MPAQKKRAAFSKPGTSPIPAPVQSSPPPVLPSRPLPTIDETRPSPQLEEMLAAEAGESVMKKKNKILYGAGMAFAFIVAGASVLLYGAYLTGPRPEKKNTADMSPVVAVTPTVTPAPFRFVLEVFNGSGVPGAAAKAAETLRTKGYEIAGTGNAKKTLLSTVFVAPGVPQDQLTHLLSDLNELFGIGSSSGILSDATASARVVIGVK